ncbi:hypothetical protein N7453_002467 [Penicillium expansum]|nr:hypothetical protein N7453_002467 [Penicillium expansum]
MVYTSDPEEYLQLRQIFQPSSENPNSHTGTSTMQPPDSTVGQRPIASAGWPLCAPSMSYASASLHPNWTMHTTIGLPTADNLYQSNMQSSSTMQYRAIDVGTEGYLSPGRTSSHTWSSALNPFTQNTTPPNENSMQSSSVKQYRATDVGTEDYPSLGQAMTYAWFSEPSPITQESAPPNKHNIEVADVKATSAYSDLQKQE